ncbi:hypothetical protein UR09_04345 [Candidatus Nitromaritima sp. SCGC AAA799-A02]|nr:hypothetical protein UR09_04345 [Candidatus Nitromaritima sp. SCGC AAA799-A02]KMP11593.1 hypothetical protein UZ36_03860 [Candidatus Nitromaritima sp. SCGC AAA799-C22]
MNPPEKVQRGKITRFFLEGDPKKRFLKFIFLVLVGFTIGFVAIRKGYQLTPESFRDFVLSLGLMGPILYTAIFIVRPLFLIPSIALFIAGGLAFGPVVGPIYASFGAALGGTVGFWFSRKMGHDYVMSKLKLGADIMETTRFSFSVVFLLSLIPVMPVTVINYGAGLSPMKFKSYIIAHILGMTPRAFAYGFFGSTLLEIGSAKFRAALIILLVFSIVTILFRWRARNRKTPKTDNNKSAPQTD